MSTGDISQATALNDTVILDATEKTEIQNILDEYNTIIENVVATNSQLHLVDIYSFFNDIAQNGYQIDGDIFQKDIIYFANDGSLGFHKTLFSYDGLHPNSRGYKSLANAYIEKINSTFGADIPIYE